MPDTSTQHTSDQLLYLDHQTVDKNAHAMH